MKLPKDQAFWTAVILHVVVLLALFLATIIEYFRPDEEVHVFEIVSASAPSPTVSEPTNSTEPPPPDIPNLDFAPLPEVPTIEIPPPQETPPPPAPPTQKPTRAPPPEKPKMMSYEEFLKHNKIREPRQQPSAPRPQVKKITINTPQINASSLPTTYQGPSQPTAAQLSALNQYTSQLSARLYRAWQQPQSLGGLNLRVKVSFFVSASGQISQVRLAPGSGNAAFDRSVLAAFRTVGNVGPTPNGQGYTWSIDFEMGQ